MLKTALRFSHQLLEECVSPGNTVIDCTMGNGHDTLFLAQLVGESGQVYGFDIQQQALDATTARLKEANCLAQTHLLLQGHETLPQVLTDKQGIHAAVFNLGYLPKGDKHITTQSDTTLIAIRTCLQHLVKKGRVILVIYSGHPEGLIEKNHLLGELQELPQEHFTVLQYQFINQRNEPPCLICIEKK